jgi:glycosyltransferase involved in cell wall biosynthesis
MTLSLVMPTYNGGEFLKEAVRSVLAQTHTDWKLLISDDGSKDGTREYLASLSDPRIQVFFQEKNLGIFGNPNFLFQQVRTDITQIFCQDDWLVDEGALARLVATWQQLPADVAFLRANHGADSYSRLARFELEVLPPIVTPEKSDLYFFLFGCIPGNLSNVSLRTRIVAEHGWFDQRLPYAGDFEFWSRVGHRERWAISPVNVATIRSHPGQASATLNKAGELLPQMATVLGTLYDRLIAAGVSPLKLQTVCSVNYVCQHRWRGLQLLGRLRSWGYMVMVNQHLGRQRFALGFLSGWLAFLATAGGRLWRLQAARWLLAH